MSIRLPVGELGKNTIIYGIGSLSAKIAAFLLIPVYTKFLSTQIVGTIALIELLETFLVGIGQMGIIQAVWAHIPRSEYSKQRQVIFSGFIGIIIINAIFLATVLSWSSTFSQLIGLGSDNNYLFFFIILNIFLQFGSIYQLSILQYQNKPISYLTLSITQLFGILVLSCFFVIYLKLDLFGAIISKTIVMIGSFIYCSFSIFKHYRSHPSMKVFFNLLKFGSPLIVLGLAGPILRLSDRFILNIFIPLSEIGIFSINYKFGMLVNMFLVAPMLKGLLPMIYKNSQNRELYPIYKDLMYYYSIAGCFFILGITFFIRPVIELISSPEYLKTTYIVPVVSLAYLFSGFRAFFMPMIAGENKTQLIGRATFYGIIISILINYALIKEYGIVGAAASTFLCYIIHSCISYFISQSLSPQDWELGRIVKLFFLTICILLMYLGLEKIFDINQIAIGIILILLFPFLLWLFKMLKGREINGLFYIFLKIKTRLYR